MEVEAEGGTQSEVFLAQEQEVLADGPAAPYVEGIQAGEDARDRHVVDRQAKELVAIIKRHLRLLAMHGLKCHTHSDLPKMAMKLYIEPLSPVCRPVMLLLEKNAVPYQEVRLNLLKGELEL